MAVNEIGQEYGVHRTQVSQSKKDLPSNADSQYEGKRGPKQVSKPPAQPPCNRGGYLPGFANGSKEEIRQATRRLEGFVTQFMLLSPSNQQLIDDFICLMLKAQRKAE